MAIKALFKSGETNIRLDTALYQWDYGQEVEIQAVDLPSLFEVHFACQGMSEAIVRPCSSTAGVGTVPIPNKCLEQTQSIVAWIFEKDNNHGATTKTFTIPIIARLRPGNTSADIPQDVSNRYTELITEVNQAIDKLESGDTVVAEATNAQEAAHATAAENANTAAYAITAGSAMSDGNGKMITTTYAQTSDLTSGAVRVAKAGEAYSSEWSQRASRATILLPEKGLTFDGEAGGFPVAGPGLYLLGVKLKPNTSSPSTHYFVTGVVMVYDESYDSEGSIFRLSSGTEAVVYDSTRKVLRFSSTDSFGIQYEYQQCYKLLALPEG